MLHNFQIQKLLIKADKVKYPYDKIKLFKKAVSIADVHNDIEWGFDLRKQIIEAEHETSSCIEGLPAFTWLLDTYDRHPELCAESTFLMEYQWMVHAAMRNANVSMEQFESILDDYKTRLLRNSFTLHSYYTAKARMAFQRNRLDEVKECLELRKSEKRDVLSACEACELHDLVEYEFLAGNVNEAVTLGLDLISGKKRCDDIPFRTICIAVNILDRRGLEDSSDTLYSIVDILLKKMRVSMSNIGYIGKLVYFLTRRDKNRAWELFEKVVRWSLNCEDYYNYMFSSGSLSLFKGSGTRSLNVSTSIPWYKPSGVYEYPELYAYYYNQAATLAAKFDARNGDANFTKELSAMD
jgi:hypothetical protein